MEAAWPLVERQRHLRRIVDLTRRPGQGALVVSGPAGVGKTRLAVEALDHLQRRRVPTGWVVATQAAAAMPYAAVAHLVPDAPTAATALQLLRQARESLDAASGGRRPVLGVDDAHLLDGPSAVLLGHLATTGSAFLLCTVRAGAQPPEAVRTLVAHGRASVLDVAELSAEAVRALLTRTLGDQVDGAAVHRMARLSEGNPLLLRELFADALRRGALEQRDELWRLSSEWTPGSGLPALVRSRPEGLSEAARHVGEALALAEPVEASLLEGLFAAEALADLDDAGLLEALPDRRRQRLRLAHPLYGEVLRAGAPPLRSRSAYRRLADGLARTGTRRRSDVVRLASWWLAAGSSGQGETWTAAARAAQVSFDHVLAERLARAGLQSGGGLGSALALADALAWQGRRAEAAAVLADWRSETPEDPGSRLALVGIFGSATDQPGVDELLAKAEASLGDGPGGALLTAIRADRAVGRWEPETALALTTPLLSDPGVDPDTLVMASEATAAALLVAGRPDAAVRVATDALETIEQAPSSPAGVLAHPLRAEIACAHLLAGRLTAGRAVASECYDAVLEAGVAPPRAWFAFLLGFADLLSGEVDAARRWLRESSELVREHRSAQGRHVRVWILGLTAEAAALHGDLPAARAALAEADTVLEPDVPVAPRALGRAWTAAAEGDPRTAQEVLRRAARDARAAGAQAYEARALHDTVRLAPAGAHVRPVADRLAQVARSAEGPLVPALAALAAAAAAADPAALDRAAETLAALGLLPYAAWAAARAGRVYGPSPEGTAALARARGLVERCRGWAAVRPDLSDLPDALAALTGREREIAALAAEGQSSREIAERLVISARTVDNHLHRAYAKLGITGRADLPPLR